MAWGETYGTVPSERPWPDNRPTAELGGAGTIRYRVEYDGEALHQTGTTRLAKEAKLELEAGTDGSLTITLGAENPMARDAEERYRLMDADHEITVLEEGEELFRGRITGIRGDMDVNVTIEAEGQLAYLRDTLVPPVANYTDDALPVGTSILGEDEPFDWFVRNHDARADASKQFRPGYAPHWRLPFAVTNWETTREAMEDALCQTGFTFVNARTGPGGERILDLVDDGVGDNAQTVVLGENMLDYARWGAADDIATAIVGTGRWPEEGQRANDDIGANTTEDPEDNPPYVEPETDPDDNLPFGQEDLDPDRQLSDDRTFGLEVVDDGSYSVGGATLQVDGDRAISAELCMLYGIVEKRVQYDATSPDELLAAIAEDLDPQSPANRRLVSLDVDALDLHKVNPRIQPIRILDWVRLYSPPHDLDQWLPCTGMSLDLCEPENSTYHFGDIPGTLTRENALRVARTRLGDGQLVRRVDGEAWNGERLWDIQQQTWDKVNGVVEDIGDRFHENDEALGDMSAGLDDLIAQYGKMGGDIDELRDYLNGRIDDIDHAQDGLIDDIEVAIAGAQRTQYGVCITGASTAAKAVTVSVPGDTQGRWPFTLANGAVVTVRFQNANTAGSATLNVNNTRSIYIMTNGLLGGFWQAGSTCRFVYDGQYWQAASTSIYGSQAVIGNPGQANFYTDGNKFSLRISTTDLIRGDWDGLQVGMDGHPNVLVHSSHINVGQETKAHVRVNEGSVNIYGSGNQRGVTITDQLATFDMGPVGSSPKSMSLGVSQGFMGLFGTEFYLHATNALELASKSVLYNQSPVIMKSVIVSARGDEFVPINVSVLGVSNIYGYAFAVTNGDYAAKDFFAIGTKVDGTTLHVMCDRAVSGTVRLNVFGWPVQKSYPYSDNGLEGPEIFGDPNEAEGPSHEVPGGQTEEVA